MTVWRRVAPRMWRREEGVLALWKGNSVLILRIFPYSAAQLAANDTYKRVRCADRGGLPPSVLEEQGWYAWPRRQSQWSSVPFLSGGRHTAALRASPRKGRRQEHLGLGVVRHDCDRASWLLLRPCSCWQTPRRTS